MALFFKNRKNTKFGTRKSSSGPVRVTESKDSKVDVNLLGSGVVDNGDELSSIAVMSFRIESKRTIVVELQKGFSDGIYSMLKNKKSHQVIVSMPEGEKTIVILYALITNQANDGNYLVLTVDALRQDLVKVDSFFKNVEDGLYTIEAVRLRD